MNGGVFQGSNTSSSSGYSTLYTISGTPPSSWSTAPSTDQATAYRWLRYYGPNGGYCNIAEVDVGGADAGEFYRDKEFAFFDCGDWCVDHLELSYCSKLCRFHRCLYPGIRRNPKPGG